MKNNNNNNKMKNKMNEGQQQNGEQQPQPTSQKPHWRFSQAITIAGSFCPLIKKMITEVLLILPLYLILFFIWWRFRHLIKIMADVGDILNNNEFLGDVVDTSKEVIEQHKKREELKSVMDKGKVHLLGHKWTYERVHKASDEIIKKTYAEFKQHELNEKGESMPLIYVLGKFFVSLKSGMLKNYGRTFRMTWSSKIRRPP